jgi:hypothetical protein
MEWQLLTRYAAATPVTKDPLLGHGTGHGTSPARAATAVDDHSHLGIVGVVGA